jgi:hypothetical protein
MFELDDPVSSSDGCVPQIGTFVSTGYEALKWNAKCRLKKITTE